MLDPHLAGEGQKEEIGDAHSVNGGHKGYGDSAADFLNVVEMLHHLDQAEHRAENSDGRRKAASGLEDRWAAVLGFHRGVEADPHDLAQLGGLGAVHGEHERLLEKWILDGPQVGVERNHTVAAALLAKAISC